MNKPMLYLCSLVFFSREGKSNSHSHMSTGQLFQQDVINLTSITNFNFLHKIKRKVY